MAREELTIAAILQELATQYHGVVAEREVMDRVLERKPSRAKDPYAGIREKLRYDGPRLGWVRLGSGQLLPLRVALEGLRFRIIPSDDEFSGDMIEWSRLTPFVSANTPGMQLEDAAGRPLATRNASLPIGEGMFGMNYRSALHLGEWFRRVGFEPGDSILVTIRAAEPITLQLEREPAAAFREQDVREQDGELVAEIVEQLARGRTHMLFPQEIVLPIYARSPWRTGYPGRPWQLLVAADPRLHLVDDLYIADSSYHRPFDRIFGLAEADAQQLAALDDALLQDIARFQSELRASRREAAEQGLWDGIAPRASTATTLFDSSDGTITTVYDGPVDALHDYSATIDERAAQGDYGDMIDEEFELDELDDADELDTDDLDTDELIDIDDIDDMQAFLEQNPGLIDATRKLMNALTPDEIAQLEEASTPDEAQRILGARLNDLLRRDPSLFAALEPAPPPDAAGSHTNGNGHGPPAADAQPEWDEQDQLIEENEWVEADWGEDDEDDEDDDDDDEDDSGQIQAALERSSEIMERFYQHQLAQGKSDSTASERTGDLWVYADFLGNYYGRALDAGDYATLDECLFFFYPRKVLSSSPRDARNMCTSIKQLYAFLRTEGLTTGDDFAQAIWRRRDQAARIVELYGRLEFDSPHFGRLFGRLFEPYTA
jgi:hypothetical protein